MKRYVIFIFAFMAAIAAIAQTGGNRSLLNRGNRSGLGRPGQNAAANSANGTEGGKPALATREDLREVPKGTNGIPALAFNQTPLELVLEAYAEQVQKTVIPAPDLPKATITLRSLEGQLLSKEEYLFAIEHVLTMNGVVLEPRGEKFLRALARKTVRTQGIPLLMENRGLLPEKGQVVSQMITFKNIAVSEAQKALEGFKDPSGLFQVFERTNAILVTDTQENINRMLEVATAIDIATPVLEDVFVRQIKFAVANDIKTALETIVTESQKEEKAKETGPKTSGAPGFSNRQPQQMGSRLLNLNNRPGQNQPPPAPTPNETMTAAIDDAARGMIRGKVLILADERSNKLIVITMKSNMDFFDKVIETLDVETEPEFKVEVVRLKYAEAEDVESMLNDLIGGTSSSSKENKNQNAKTATNTKQNITSGNKPPAAGTAGAKKPNANQGSVGDLNKDNCKVLADKRINGIVIMTRKELMPVIMQVIEDMDVKLSQVLIETLILEVTLGDDLQTGVDWVQRGWNEDGTARDGMINRNNYMLGGGGGTSASTLQTMLKAGTNILSAAAWGGATPTGSGVNYFLKSDKLNLGAVIAASKTDSRAKYVASPIVMTVDNKEATVEATSARQFLTGWQAVSSSYAGSGLPSPTYSQKDIGITLKMTPKINPNGTIMLTVEEEYSQVSEKQSMMVPKGSTYDYQTIDVPATRKMSSDVRLENRQTVVLGGLVEKSTSESESGVPFLKDIPWVGKWLFGTVSQSETRKELLVFLTPYVLDDESAAQLEALRRKKALSDPRPWDDNGWSASPIADPVSKKEQLRRFQDEWKKQDEERKTKLAIEKAKFERAQMLKGMTQTEREEWIKIHRAELEEEAKASFDKQMEEQKNLREFVDELKKSDLKQAESEIKKAENGEKNEGEEKTGNSPEEQAARKAQLRSAMDAWKQQDAERNKKPASQKGAEEVKSVTADEKKSK